MISVIPVTDIISWSIKTSKIHLKLQTLEEASIHKSAKTHIDIVFLTCDPKLLTLKQINGFLGLIVVSVIVHYLSHAKNHD